MLRLRLSGVATGAYCSALLAGLLTITLLVWQFGPFVLLVQIIALLACFCLGAAREDAVTSIFRAMALASVTTSAVMLGNWMVFCSFATCTIAGWELIRRSFSRSTAHPVNRYPFWGRLGLSVGSLILGFGGKIASQHLIGGQPDGHITSILRAKIDPNHNDFMTMIYLCGPSFNFMTPEQLTELTETTVLPLAAGVAIVGTLSTIVACLRGRYTEAEDHGDLLFLAIAVAGYGILATLLARLVILFLPGAIILAALSTSRRMIDWLAIAASTVSHEEQLSAADGHHRKPSDDTNTNATPGVKQRSWHCALYCAVRLLQVAASVALLIHVQNTLARPTYLNLLDSAAAPPDGPDETTTETVQVVEFMSQNLPLTAVIAADPPLSSTIRALTAFPIVVIVLLEPAVGHAVNCIGRVGTPACRRL